MGTPAAAGVKAWHDVVRNLRSDPDGQALDALLADEVVFHSPVVHTPQEGRALTKLYLMAAFNVFPGSKPGSKPANEATTTSSAAPDEGGRATPTRRTETAFRYVREVVGDYDAVLEFVTEMDGITVNGVDMIRWNDAGKIVDFKVMVRPLKAIQKVHAQMAAMLEGLKKGG